MTRDNENEVNRIINGVVTSFNLIDSKIDWFKSRHRSVDASKYFLKYRFSKPRSRIRSNLKQNMD